MQANYETTKFAELRNYVVAHGASSEIVDSLDAVAATFIKAIAAHGPSFESNDDIQWGFKLANVKLIWAAVPDQRLPGIRLDIKATILDEHVFTARSYFLTGAGGRVINFIAENEVSNWWPM